MISTDNLLRIYECIEQPSLTSWQLIEELDVQMMALVPSSGYITRAHTIALATPTQTHVTLDAASASLVSQALQQGLQQQQQQQQQLAGGSVTGAQSRSGLGNREADGGWCISWCKDRYWGEIIAAGCGTNGIVKVFLMFCNQKPSLTDLFRNLFVFLYRLYS